MNNKNLANQTIERSIITKNLAAHDGTMNDKYFVLELYYFTADYKILSADT